MLSKPSSSSWSGSGPWSYWAQYLASLFKERKDSQLVTIYQCWQVVSLSQQLGILPVFREWKGTRMGKERIVVLVWAESYLLELQLWDWCEFFLLPVRALSSSFSWIKLISRSILLGFLSGSVWNVAVCCSCNRTIWRC